MINNTVKKNHLLLIKKCWKGLIALLIASILSGVYYFFSIYFIDVLHFNISTAGFLLSFYGLGTIVGGYLGGKFADKFTPLQVVFVSLFVQSIAFLILTQAKSFSWIAINLFILGAFTYSFITANYLWVLSNFSHSEKDRLTVINYLVVASNLGIGISAIIIGELSIFNFDYIFWTCGFLLLFLSLFLGFTKKEEHPHTKELINTASEQPQRSNGLMYLILFCLFFTGIIVSQLGATYSIYLKQTFPRLGTHAFSYLFALSTILIVCFQNFLISRVNHFNQVLMIGLGSFFIGFGMLMLNFSYTFAIAIVACVIYSIGEMLFFSITQLFCYQQGNINNKGKKLGEYRMIYASSRLVGPAVGGAIYNYFSGATLWYLCGIVGIFFLILCNRFK